MELEKLSRDIRDRLAKKGAGNFEIFLQAKRGHSVVVLQGKRETFEVKNGLGYGLRLIEDGRLGFSYGTDFSDAAVDFVIDQCRASLKEKESDPHCDFPAPSAPSPADPGLSDPDFGKLNAKEKLALALDMERAAYAFNPAVKNVRNASFEDELEETYILNSKGVALGQQRTVSILSISAIAEDGQGSEIGYEHDSRVSARELNPREVGESAAGSAVRLLGGGPIPNYAGAVVLDRNVAADILGVLGSSFSAESVAKRNSYLADKQGQSVYAKSLNIVDDGLLPGGSGTGIFDGEGVAKQRTSLVENGVVQNWLFDSYWALRLGKKSTGNAHRANSLSQPRLSHNNLHITPGNKTQDELLRELGRGVLITDVIGIHTADPISGDFSVGMQGLWVEGGKIQRAVRSVALSGNLHKLFADVAAVGSDLKFYGRVGSPSLLIQRAEISGV